MICSFWTAEIEVSSNLVTRVARYAARVVFAETSLADDSTLIQMNVRTPWEPCDMISVETVIERR
jgi:hypothetical protein